MYTQTPDSLFLRAPPLVKMPCGHAVSAGVRDPRAGIVPHLTSHSVLPPRSVGCRGDLAKGGVAFLTLVSFRSLGQPTSETPCLRTKSQSPFSRIPFGHSPKRPPSCPSSWRETQNRPTQSKAPEGTKRATSANVQLPCLQKDLRKGSISRDMVNFPSELCRRRSGMFAEVARLVPPEGGTLPGGWRRVSGGGPEMERSRLQLLEYHTLPVNSHESKETFPVLA